MSNLQITFSPVVRYEFRLNGMVFDHWQTHREHAVLLYGVWQARLSETGATCVMELIDTSTGEIVGRTTLA